MVAENPLFSKWSLKKFKATVINDIWPEVLFFSAVAASESVPIHVAPPPWSLRRCGSFRPSTVVSLVSDLTRHKLSFSSAMLTVLGTVLGLVISFRTSSAYERLVCESCSQASLSSCLRFSPPRISYMEGRKLWTAIALSSRNLAQIVSLHRRLSW